MLYPVSIRKIAKTSSRRAAFQAILSLLTSKLKDGTIIENKTDFDFTIWFGYGNDLKTGEPVMSGVKLNIIYPTDLPEEMLIEHGFKELTKKYLNEAISELKALDTISLAEAA